MNLLKLAAIAAVVIAVVLFLLPGRHEHPVSFENREFKHAETFSRDGLTSYFYTPGGGNPGAADEFIQLIVFDEGLSEDHRAAILRQTTGSFRLEPFGSDDGTYLGGLAEQGQKIRVYGRDARSPYLDSIALYVTAQEIGDSEAAGNADGYFQALAGIQSAID